MVVFLLFLLDIIIEFCMFGWWIFYIFLMYLIPMTVCALISDEHKLPHKKAFLGLFAAILVVALMLLLLTWCWFGSDGIKDLSDFMM